MGRKQFLSQKEDVYLSGSREKKNPLRLSFFLSSQSCFYLYIGPAINGTSDVISEVFSTFGSTTDVTTAELLFPYRTEQVVSDAERESYCSNATAEIIAKVKQMNSQVN